MKFIRTYPMGSSSILKINAERSLIDQNPEYQRNSGIWTLDKRQLLIDSILNEYDIPKIYFHDLRMNRRSGSGKYDYAIIDGRQRLETIWKFIDGDFALAKKFEFYDEPSLELEGMTYSDLAKNHPSLKVRFDGFSLPITLVETDDRDLIEDMFSRLNEAVPLNAAEKRNAMGGPMVDTIREVAKHPFFTNRVSFTDRRSQHHEVACRLLFIENCLRNQRRLIDTKKPYLDNMVKEFKERPTQKPTVMKQIVVDSLDQMKSIFVKNDVLLRSQSSVPVYYLLVRNAIESSELGKISRNKLERFRDKLKKNRKIAEKDITRADFELLEFERMSQQGTNDASSIRERVNILSANIGLSQPYYSSSASKKTQ